MPNLNNLIADDDYDPIEYGIIPKSIHLNETLLKDNEIINPFYVGQGGGNIKELNWGDIHRNYNSLIIITTTNYSEFNLDNFFKEIITDDDIKNMPLIYYRAPINILKNKDHYFRANVIAKKYLSKLFSFGDFNESEIVLSIFEMNEENTRKYCELYKLSDNISEISKSVDMIDYYLYDPKIHKNVNYNNITSKLKDSDYWKNRDNLDINLTDSFVSREFNNQRTGTNNIVVLIDRNNKTKKIENVNKIIKNGDKEYIKNGDKEYIENGDKEYIKKGDKEYINTDHMENIDHNGSGDHNASGDFTDSLTLIRHKQNGRNFYATIPDTNYTNDDIFDLFNRIEDDKLKYDLLNNMLVSKEYCHLVVNNYKVLDSLKNMFNKYKGVFKYTLGYSWLTFYLEENVTRTKSTKYSRFSFDINTASRLPVFPFVYSDIKQNPYITALIDDSEIILGNLYGLSCVDNYDGYGICDFDTFKRRFNIFASHDASIDPLKGLNWDKFAVSGSAIPACLQKRSPLLDELIIQSNGNDDEGFNKFARKYYDKSDIDLMTNEPSIVEFLKSVETVYNLLKTNLNASDDERGYEVVKTFAVSITEHFFTDFLDDFNKTYSINITKEEFEKMTGNIILKIYLYNKYIYSKNKQTSILFGINSPELDNKFVKDFIIPNNYESMNIYMIDSAGYDNFNNIDSDMVYRRNDLRGDFANRFSDKDNKVVIKISENYRFKLRCKLTNIEMFRIKDREFFNTVSRFHFPCVRGYYNGNNVHILPSCITAMMTGLNIEYKYFSGIRDPHEIVNKYLSRGFGVILNKYEINKWIEYNKLNNIYKNALGEKTADNEIYKLQNVTEDKKKLYTLEDLKKHYNTIKNIDFTKMKTISEKGNINKYCSSYVDFCYEIINQ